MFLFYAPFSLLFPMRRIFIIWAISSLFRRSPATPEQSGPAGAPRVPSRNLFPKDTLMVLPPADTPAPPRGCN